MWTPTPSRACAPMLRRVSVETVWIRARAEPSHPTIGPFGAIAGLSSANKFHLLTCVMGTHPMLAADQGLCQAVELCDIQERYHIPKSRKTLVSLERGHALLPLRRAVLGSEDTLPVRATSTGAHGLWSARNSARFSRLLDIAG